MHMFGTDDITWKDAIGGDGDPDLNTNAKCLLQLCCKHSQRKMYAFSTPKGTKKIRLRVSSSSLQLIFQTLQQTYFHL